MSFEKLGEFFPSSGDRHAIRQNCLGLATHFIFCARIDVRVFSVFIFCARIDVKQYSASFSVFIFYARIDV